MSQAPVPCLWFDGNALEAAEYYCSIFKDSKITGKTPWVVTFELNGQKFKGLNGGPLFTFNESVSFIIECKNQEEIDYYWDQLSMEGKESNCGWLKDKFGLSWQIVPDILGSLMSNPEKAPAVMKAFMSMKKFIIQDLLNA